MSEQSKRLSLGDDEVEAGRRAMWMLRSEGIDIRVKQVGSVVIKSMFLLVARADMRKNTKNPSSLSLFVAVICGPG